jgi:L-seryl-tRNA(Ser) seleniumtransferase
MRYAELGVEPVINAAMTSTALGGSLMPPPVVEAMASAAGSFVDMAHLQRAVGERLARLTRNEAGFVTSGAAAGIALAVTACLTRGGAEPAAFPPGSGEVVVFRGQRTGYQYAARQTGARLVEVAGTAEAFVAGVNDRTACVLWFAGPSYARDALPIAEVVAIAQALGVPVLVDAAAQIPPVASLWHYTAELGADAVIVSGGKGLRGPQASGLVLGRSWIVEGCRAHACPHPAIGRPMKVGKEEILGLLAAVEWTLGQDEPATLASYESSVRRWVDGLAGLPGVQVWRGYPSEAGQPHSRALIRLAPESGWIPDRLVAALWQGRPRIAVGRLDADPDVLALNPQTLQPGEDGVVLAALRELLHGGPP